MSKFMTIGDKAIPKDDILYIEKAGGSERAIIAYWKSDRVHLIITFKNKTGRDKAFAYALKELGGLPAKDHTQFLYGETVGNLTHFRVVFGSNGNILECTKKDDRYYLSQRQKNYLSELRHDLSIVDNYPEERCKLVKD